MEAIRQISEIEKQSFKFLKQTTRDFVKIVEKQVFSYVGCRNAVTNYKKYFNELSSTVEILCDEMDLSVEFTEDYYQWLLEGIAEFSTMFRIIGEMNERLQMRLRVCPNDFGQIYAILTQEVADMCTYLTSAGQAMLVCLRHKPGKPFFDSDCGVHVHYDKCVANDPVFAGKLTEEDEVLNIVKVENIFCVKQEKDFDYRMEFEDSKRFARTKLKIILEDKNCPVPTEGSEGVGESPILTTMSGSKDNIIRTRGMFDIPDVDIGKVIEIAKQHYHVNIDEAYIAEILDRNYGYLSFHESNGGVDIIRNGFIQCARNIDDTNKNYYLFLLSECFSYLKFQNLWMRKWCKCDNIFDEKGQLTVRFVGEAHLNSSHNDRIIENFSKRGYKVYGEFLKNMCIHGYHPDSTGCQRCVFNSANFGISDETRGIKEEIYSRMKAYESVSSLIRQKPPKAKHGQVDVVVSSVKYMELDHPFGKVDKIVPEMSGNELIPYQGPGPIVGGSNNLGNDFFKQASTVVANPGGVGTQVIPAAKQEMMTGPSVVLGSDRAKMDGMNVFNYGEFFKDLADYQMATRLSNEAGAVGTDPSGTVISDQIAELGGGAQTATGELVGHQSIHDRKAFEKFKQDEKDRMSSSNTYSIMARAGARIGTESRPARVTSENQDYMGALRMLATVRTLSWSLGAMAERPIPQTGVAWSTSQAPYTLVAAFETPTDIMNNPVVQNVVNAYTFGNFGVEMAVRLTGGPMYQGQVAVSFWRMMPKAMAVFHAKNPATISSNRDTMILDASSSDGGTLYVPFLHPQNLLRLDNPTPYDILGTYTIVVWQQLATGVGAPTTISVSVNTALKNSTFYVPRMPASGVENGVVHIESEMGNSTSTTKQYNYYGGYTTGNNNKVMNNSDNRGVVNGALQTKGGDISASPSLTMPLPDMDYVANLTHPQWLRLAPEVQFMQYDNGTWYGGLLGFSGSSQTYQTKLVFGTDVDEMSFDHIFRSMYVSEPPITWSTSDAVGKILLNLPITPFPKGLDPTVKVGDQITMNMAEWVINFYGQWSGGIRVAFNFAMTSYHKGILGVGVFPGKYIPKSQTTIGPLASHSQYYEEVQLSVDMGGRGPRIVKDIGFISPEGLMNYVPRGAKWLTSETARDDQGRGFNNYASGTLLVWVQNSLVTSNAASNYVTFIVERGFAEDFMVKNPDAGGTIIPNYSPNTGLPLTRESVARVSVHRARKTPALGDVTTRRSRIEPEMSNETQKITIPTHDMKRAEIGVPGTEIHSGGGHSIPLQAFASGENQGSLLSFFRRGTNYITISQADMTAYVSKNVAGMSTFAWGTAIPITPFLYGQGVQYGNPSYVFASMAMFARGGINFQVWGDLSANPYLKMFAFYTPDNFNASNLTFDGMAALINSTVFPDRAYATGKGWINNKWPTGYYSGKLPIMYTGDKAPVITGEINQTSVFPMQLIYPYAPTDFPNFPAVGGKFQNGTLFVGFYSNTAGLPTSPNFAKLCVFLKANDDFRVGCFRRVPRGIIAGITDGSTMKAFDGNYWQDGSVSSAVTIRPIPDNTVSGLVPSRNSLGRGVAYEDERETQVTFEIAPEMNNEAVFDPENCKHDSGCVACRDHQRIQCVNIDGKAVLKCSFDAGMSAKDKKFIIGQILNTLSSDILRKSQVALVVGTDCEMNSSEYVMDRIVSNFCDIASDVENQQTMEIVNHQLLTDLLERKMERVDEYYASDKEKILKKRLVMSGCNVDYIVSEMGGIKGILKKKNGFQDAPVWPLPKITNFEEMVLYYLSNMATSLETIATNTGTGGSGSIVDELKKIKLDTGSLLANSNEVYENYFYPLIQRGFPDQLLELIPTLSDISTNTKDTSTACTNINDNIVELDKDVVTINDNIIDGNDKLGDISANTLVLTDAKMVSPSGEVSISVGTNDKIDTNVVGSITINVNPGIQSGNAFTPDPQTIVNIGGTSYVTRFSSVLVNYGDENGQMVAVDVDNGLPVSTGNTVMNVTPGVVVNNKFESALNTSPDGSVFSKVATGCYTQSSGFVLDPTIPLLAGNPVRYICSAVMFEDDGGSFSVASMGGGLPVGGCANQQSSYWPLQVTPGVLSTTNQFISDSLQYINGNPMRVGSIQIVGQPDDPSINDYRITGLGPTAMSNGTYPCVITNLNSVTNKSLVANKKNIKSATELKKFHQFWNGDDTDSDITIVSDIEEEM